MNSPFLNNQNMMNQLMSNSYQNNALNPMLINNNINPILANSNQNIIYPQNINNMNYRGNLNLQQNMNNFNPHSMFGLNNMVNNQCNNMNQNFTNLNINNQNIMNNITDINTNRNNLNENNLINNFDNLNLNNRKETIYKDIINYIPSEETKLILHNNQISRGNLVSNLTAISPTLQCAICLDLVMTPVECKNCTKLFCKDCIDNWLKNESECPNKHKFEKKEELDDWIIKALSKIFLKCPYNGCKSDYAYKHWTSHVKNCPFKSKGVRKLNNETTDCDDEPFKWENVQFFVKDIHGKTHIFELPLSTTVLELKEKLKQKTGFEVEAQRLTLNGKIMDNTKMLEYYGLQKNQTIFQLARLKG